jgi:deoxyguanosine kinase
MDATRGLAPFRIEICGGIASGKTTFARLFEDAATVLLEDFTSVPFWSAFCHSPTTYGLEAEISFLLQHYHQIKRHVLENPARGLLVCDFSFSLDYAYSVVSLDERKREAFNAVYNEVIADLGPPRLIVQLACSPETQMRRIRARGRSVEDRLTLGFLQSLNSAVGGPIAPAHLPRLAFDSESTDFALDAETRLQCKEDVLTRVGDRSSYGEEGGLERRGHSRDTNR